MKLFKSLKRKACKITAIVGAAFLTLSVFAWNVMAQTTTTSGLEIQELVSAADVKTDLYNAIGPWIKGGLSVAVTIFLVRLGWRLIKSFTNRG